MTRVCEALENKLDENNVTKDIICIENYIKYIK